MKEDEKQHAKTAGEPEKPEAGNAGGEQSLSEVIARQANEEEPSHSSGFSLRKILGGDFLTASFLKRQIWLLFIFAVFVVIYISNRYSVQKDLIEIDRLQKELQDAKYRALSTNAQLTEKSRESNVLERLKNNKDSVLKVSSQPPYIINVPDDDRSGQQNDNDNEQ